jgi:hypothetical protein
MGREWLGLLALAGHALGLLQLSSKFVEGASETVQLSIQMHASGHGGEPRYREVSTPRHCRVCGLGTAESPLYHILRRLVPEDEERKSLPPKTESVVDVSFYLFLAPSTGLGPLAPWLLGRRAHQIFVGLASGAWFCFCFSTEVIVDHIAELMAF